MAIERALRVPCGEAAMVALLHEPDERAAAEAPGVLVIVGGPQSRTGGHRQFTLLARSLAASGLPVMRFDCRGKGDSSGTFTDFECIDEDVRAAMDQFFAERPGMAKVILWGLCDGASAALLYAHKDPRVGGIVFLNPWVRTEQGKARAYLKHYYARRLASADFWRKVLGGGLDLASALRGLAGNLGTAASARRAGRTDGAHDAIDALPLPEKLAAHFGRYDGPSLLILSGNDLTAREFEDCVAVSPRWPGLLASPGVTRRRLHEADHTFSRRAWREQVADWTATWIHEAVGIG